MNKRIAITRINKKFESIDKSFALFVQEYGGEMISTLLPSSGFTLKNADYLFRERNVIVELKSFMKDHFQSEKDYERIESRICKATETGFLSEHELDIWRNTGEPSEKIRKLILSGLQKTTEGSLRHAKHQIEEIRRALNIPDAIGFVLFSNERNSFPPSIHEEIIVDLIDRRYRNVIDGFVYFSTERLMKVDTEINSCIYWQQYDWIKEKKLQKSISDFIDDIGRKWIDFVCNHTGGSPKLIRHSDAENVAEQMNKAKYVNGAG